MKEFVPYPYQTFSIQKVLDLDAVGLFLDMGLGKTVITLTAVKKLLYEHFSVSKVLVIAPLKVAEATWTKEAKQWAHLQDLNFSLVLGSLKKRKEALAASADVYVINRENVAWLVEHYGRNWPFDMVVIDELSSFKSSKAKRFKALAKVRPLISRVVGLTGTPAPNGYIDLWAQVYLLDSGKRLGKSVYQYKNRYFDQNLYSHTTKIKEGASSAIDSAIKDICISMKSEDYLDLPERIIQDIPVILDDDAKKNYDTLEKQMVLELFQEGGEITAKNATVLSGKLLQLCGGAVYNQDKKAVSVHSCKLEAFDELLEGLQGQHALVFYGYQHEKERLLELLKKRKAVHRELKTKEDQEDWNAGKIQILLAHPASVGYGLNLQHGGHHIIWFGLTWSLELYQQANKRLHRQGQSMPVTIHRLLVQGGMDEDVATALEGKENLQDALIESLKARVEKWKTIALN